MTIMMIVMIAVMMVFGLKLMGFLVRLAIVSAGFLLKLTLWAVVGMAMLGLVVALLKLAPILLLLFVLAAICRSDLFTRRA